MKREEFHALLDRTNRFLVRLALGLIAGFILVSAFNGIVIQYLVNHGKILSQGQCEAKVDLAVHELCGEGCERRDDR